MRSSRRAFTLLEVVLATTISASIAGVCLGLFVFFDRTDARLQERFLQNAELSRLYIVQQRAFGTLLLSDKPKVLKDAEQRLRNPGEAKDGGAGEGGEGDLTNPDAIRSRGRRVDLRNHPEIIAIREQIPPRLELSIRDDVKVDAPEFRDAIPGYSAIRAQRFTTMPQRLELVLTESPVPSKGALDDPDALMERVAKQRAREKQQLRRMRAAADSANNAGGNATGSRDDFDSADGDEAEDFDFETPMRAVRGSFELRPMVPVGADVSSQVRGWEVWWVPLPREAGPDEEQDDGEQILDEPYLVASGIAYIEWKVFQGRERRTQYVGRLNDDIPAYIEVEVETIGGLKANWLFEVDWSFGNESRPTTPPTPVGGTPTTPSTPTTPGTPTPSNPTVPGQPIQPAPITPSQPAGERPPTTPPRTIKPGGQLQPTGPEAPFVKPNRRRKEGAQ
jgi:type II secretory pathway pseudopilin PulG